MSVNKTNFEKEFSDVDPRNASYVSEMAGQIGDLDTKINTLFERQAALIKEADDITKRLEPLVEKRKIMSDITNSLAQKREKYREHAKEYNDLSVENSLLDLQNKRLKDLEIQAKKFVNSSKGMDINDVDRALTGLIEENATLLRPLQWQKTTN